MGWSALHCMLNHNAVHYCTLHGTLHCAAGCTSLHYTFLYAALHCMLHCTALHAAKHCTVLHCTALSDALYCTVRCTALQCAALHFTACRFQVWPPSSGLGLLSASPTLCSVGVSSCWTGLTCSPGNVYTGKAGPAPERTLVEFISTYLLKLPGAEGWAP